MAKRTSGFHKLPTDIGRPHPLKRFLCVGCVLLATTFGQFPAIGLSDEPSNGVVARAEKAVDFTRDIRPLLSDRCFACHGPDQASLESNLSLHHKQSVFGDETDSGKIPVVAGDAGASELVRRIMATDEGEQMPPPEVEKQLTHEEKQLIRRWVDEGARWKEHWAYVAPVRTELPEVSDADWCRTPIDYFILSRLDTEELLASAVADRETLLRRLTFDLTGLPATLDQVDSFLADESPNAYERVVDRLLKTSSYGEHMARYWLDAARYSDTHGMHYDDYREIWPYRDWVIRAYNNNKPFDQFTVEQLAGDLLETPTRDQVVATGFGRCHVSTSEGGSIEQEVHVRNVVDRVVTTNLVFMASTFECTRCHDHKFDPFTMEDFYNEFAFFNSIDGPSLDGNVKDTYPIVHVPSMEQSEALAEIEMRLQQIIAQQAACLSASEQSFSRWIQAQQQKIADKSEAVSDLSLTEDLVGHYCFDSLEDGGFRNTVNDEQVAAIHGEMKTAQGRFGNGCRITDQVYVTLPGPFNFPSDEPFSLGAWVNCPKGTAGTVLAKAQSKAGVARYRGYTLGLNRGVVEFSLTNDVDRYDMQVVTADPIVSGEQWQHLFVTYDGTSKAAGVTIYVDGVRQPVEVKLDAIFTKGSSQPTTSKSSLRLGRRDDDFRLPDGLIDDVRVYKRRLSASEVFCVAYAQDLPTLIALTVDQRSEQQTESLLRYHANAVDQEYIALVAVEEALRQKRRAVIAQFPTTLVFRERAEPRTAYMLKRGEYDQQGERATRAIPTFLSPMPKGAPPNRLGFAQWLVAPDHPLTSRVQVNRLWQQVFGSGIVTSVGDFGSQGTPPSHPQLLDWLAVEFRESGWDVKALMKMMVMSSTYRQSSELTPTSIEQDPDNRLLARGSRYRLDAEMIRDQALAVSGLLVQKTGGPSVKPPQPDGIWFAVSMSGERFVGDTDPAKIHRRSLYTFIKRTAGPPQMSILDGPTREICSVQRERTDTPIQALLLMNDPQLIEAAIALAGRTLDQGGQSSVRKVEFLYRLCTARHPSGARTTEMMSLYNDMLVLFTEDPAAASQLVRGHGESKANIDLAAWTMVANLVLNLDEVLSKN